MTGKGKGNRRTLDPISPTKLCVLRVEGCHRWPCGPWPVDPAQARPIWPGPSTARPVSHRARASPAREPCPGLGRHPSPWAGTARHENSRQARCGPFTTAPQPARLLPPSAPSSPPHFPLARQRPLTSSPNSLCVSSTAVRRCRFRLPLLSSRSLPPAPLPLLSSTSDSDAAQPLPLIEPPPSSLALVTA